MKNLNDLMETQHTNVAITMNRAIANSALASAIYTASAKLNNAEWLTRNPDANQNDPDDFGVRTQGNTIHTDLDQRNQKDHELEGESLATQIRGLQGFEPRISYDLRIERLMSVVQYANDEIETLSDSKFDRAMNMEDMFKLLATPSIRVPEYVMRQQAIDSGRSIEAVKSMHYTDAVKKAGALVDQKSEIFAILKAATPEQSGSTAIEEVGIIKQHQLAAKSYIGCDKAITRIQTARRQRPGDQSLVELHRDAKQQILNWMVEVEQTHEAEFGEAEGRGANPIMSDELEPKLGKTVAEFKAAKAA